MKKYIPILFTIIIGLVAFKSNIKSELTSRLAVNRIDKFHKNYYETIEKLRNQTQDYLNKLAEIMKQDVLKLKQNHKHNTAQNLEINYKKIYTDISSDIDEIFEKLDKEFVLTSKDYNDDQMSDSNKLAFIEKMKEKATKIINELTSKNIADLKKHLLRY